MTWRGMTWRGDELTGVGRHQARDAEIVRRYAAGGVTLSQLGRAYGKTDARIWQIINKARRQQQRAHDA